MGEDAQANCGGKGLAIATGRNGMAKGAVGTWLVLAERDRYERIVAIIPVYVDGESIKSDTWYTAKKGKVLAVDEN